MIELIESIKLKNVCKSFNVDSTQIDALFAIDLTINQGDIIVFFGPSGSGKSTLFSIIGAIESPTTGEILFDEQNLQKLSMNERILLRKINFGFVFQNFALINWLTIEENLTYYLLLKGIKDPQEQENRISYLLSSFNLETRKSMFPPDLSAGEKQRIAIARALVNDPPFILADEPTGRLDYDNARLIWDLLIKYSKTTSKTLIVFTHDSRLDFLDNNIQKYLLEYGHLKQIN